MSFSLFKQVADGIFATSTIEAEYNVLSKAIKELHPIGKLPFSDK